jgi:hypothetical protein
MLDALESEYVILWLEDQFISAPVDDHRVREHIRLGLDRRSGFFRLRPLGEGAPLPSRTLEEHPDVGVFDRGAPYRVVMQPALWKVATLRRLLVPGLSPWEFEVTGTQLSNQLADEFLGPLDFVVTTEHAVEKGKWRPAGLEICRRAGVVIDRSTRPELTTAELLALATTDGAAEAYIEATLAFRRGQRRAGWRNAMRALRVKPGFVQAWVTAVAGTISPVLIDILERFHVARRLRAARRRYAQKLEENTDATRPRVVRPQVAWER